MISFGHMVHQIGYAVRDVDAAVRQFERINGPQDFARFQWSMGDACGYRYLGEPASCRLDIALAKIDGIDHEFIAVLEGRHPAADYVAAHGAGINHLSFYLRDIGPFAQHALDHGGRIIVQAEWPETAIDSRRVRYIAFEEPAFPMYELIELRSLDPERKD